jgi:hypothetical protein
VRRSLSEVFAETFFVYFVACIAAVAVHFSLSASGCAAAVDGADSYAAQNGACVALASSPAQAKACVMGTRALYCGPEGLLAGDAGKGFCTGIELATPAAAAASCSSAPSSGPSDAGAGEWLPDAPR